MHRADLLRPFQVGDSAAEFDDAVEGAGAEAELVYGAAEEIADLVTQDAVLLQMTGAHVGVADDAGAVEALRLNLSRTNHALPDRL